MKKICNVSDIDGGRQQCLRSGFNKMWNGAFPAGWVITFHYNVVTRDFTTLTLHNITLQSVSLQISLQCELQCVGAAVQCDNLIQSNVKSTKICWTCEKDQLPLFFAQSQFNVTFHSVSI